MAETTIHAMLTEHPGYGWNVESPQLPELVAGRDTYGELMNDLVTILQFGGAPTEYQMVRHVQRQLVTQEGLDYIVRWVQDCREDERVAGVKALLECLEVKAQRDDLFDAQRTPTGDVLFVSALPDDLLGPLFDQMDPRGDALTIFTRARNQSAVVSTQILLNAKPDGDWKTLDRYGLSRESTVADMFEAMSEYTELHDRALVLA